ncbi:MAG: S1 RNA-binding domain-containing protein [Chitinispirillaceae bacterium]|nr:S1 RNA-binding domain-containing protein [Chitinispirillaceae bacterium]
MFDKKDDNFFGDKKEEGKESEVLMQLLDSYDKRIATDLKPGTRVNGTITRIGDEYIFVDIGSKNEAILKKSELIEDGINLPINIGDAITAYIISNTADETILSKRLGGHHAAKSELFNARSNQIPVLGKVTGVSKDGLIVKILGYRAFCPISQIDLRFTEDVNHFLGKTFEFVITRIAEGGKNIIVSRIPLLEKELSEKLAGIEKSIESHSILHGTITAITDFGIFVDIGGVEGLVHISELSWAHVDAINEIYSPGQEIDCIALQVTRKKPLKNSKISLSIKQLHEDPWTNIRSRFICGQSVRGKVVRLTSFGAFIELIPGVDGLVHISEMSWLKKVRHPSELLTVGNLVNATVIAIDENKKNISLSLKDVSNDPWREVEERFPPGAEVPGVVVKKSRYGYFINLTEGVTGLLVFSNIIAHKKDSIKEGETIHVVVESVDIINRRISLSHGLKETHNHDGVTKFLNDDSAQQGAGNASTEFGAALFAALNNRK